VSPPRPTNSRALLEQAREVAPGADAASLGRIAKLDGRVSESDIAALAAAEAHGEAQSVPVRVPDAPRFAGGQRRALVATETSTPDGAAGQDVAEPKSAEDNPRRELEEGRILLGLYERALTLTYRQLWDYALDQCVRLTGSSIGFFHRVSDDQSAVILTAWNAEALKGCTADYETTYPIDRAGNWVDSVRLKRPIVYNDYSTSPNRRGLPPGHFPVRRFMSVPVLEGDRIRLIFGVGNKAEPYDDRDLVLLQLFANELQKILSWRHAEAALRASEERYRTLVEQSSDTIFVLDAEGRVVEVNTAVERLLGYAQGALLGRRWDALITPDDLAAHGLHLADLRAGKELRVEHDMRHSDGSIVSVEVSAKMLPDGRYLQIARDIGERKAAEEERRRLTAAIDQSQDAVLLTDEQRRIIYANRAFETLSGYPVAKLAGEPPEAVFGGSGIAKIPADAPHRLLAGEAWVGEIQSLGADGCPFTAEWSISPVHDEIGTPIGHVAIARDRSAERALEEQLRQSQRMEVVGQLAGGIAHDFNNLLTAIRGYGELVRERLPIDDEEIRPDIDQVVSAADRAAALTRQLLAFSRRQVLQPEVLEPAAIVEDIAPMLRRLLGEHITLVTHTKSNLGHVEADPGQLEQVIVNLAVNARDAMSNGGTLTIEMANAELDADYAAVHAEVIPGPYVLLSVSDTGVGMHSETRDHIFEPFFTTKEPGQGTGLGLASVYGIVKQSGGSINVYSEPGHGTTFRIYVPRVVEAPTTAVTEAPTARPSSSGTETILLVEDEAAVRAFARRALELKGYTVLEATSGVDALSLAALHGGSIPLLVTDVIMPGMQGHQLAAQLGATRPCMRVLYVSGFTENSVIQHGVPGQGVAFLPKPFTAEALCGTVRRVLDDDEGRMTEPARMADTVVHAAG
jgi:PAS domain S-box-containing protein